MLCPVCQKFNPDSNSFCGHCGQPLAMNQIPSNYPREGFDEVDEPEIQQIDPRIPANEYTRPRSINRKEQAAEKVQAPVAARNTAGEAESTPSRATSSRNSTSIFGLENAEPPKFETDPYSVKPVSNSMFDFEPSQQRNQSIHGPSFLGLSDPEFLDDEEEPSHARRNWLLVALLAVIVIGAVQWRNIRDTGMQYAGTLHFNLPLKKGQGQAQVAQEKAGTAESGESSAAGEGKPEMEVNPTTNGAASGAQANNSADQSKSGQNNLLTSQPDQSKTANSAGAGDSSSKSAASEGQSQPAAAVPDKSAADNKALTSKSQEAPDKAQTDSGDQSEVAEARSPDKKPGREGRARKSEPPAPKPNPGSDDVARAMSASDPATSANWLWAATKKGNTEAPVLLADYYAKGRGVPKDCEQATVLLRSAARAGNPRASARLGMYYATGQCVAQDRAEAWHWLSVAHDKDPSSDWVEQYRRRLWTEMTPDERARSGNGPTASE